MLLFEYQIERQTKATSKMHHTNSQIGKSDIQTLNLQSVITSPISAMLII